MTRLGTLLITVLAFIAVRPRADAQWGEAQRYIQGQRQGKPIFCVGTFGRRIREQGHFASTLQNTVEFIFDNKRSQYAHIQLRVGEKAYHLYATRKAEAVLFKNYELYGNPQVGAVFCVSPETIKIAQAAMDRASTSANRHNLPHFNITNKHPLLVHDGKQWRNVETRRADNVVQAQLVREGDSHYLQTDAGYRQRVKLEAPGKVRVECKTCTSFITDLLFELNRPDLPRVKTFAARGLADKLFGGRAEIGVKPAAFTYYHPEDVNPANLERAFGAALE